MKLSPVQQQLIKRINPSATIDDWYDWRWHIKNSIRSIEQFEHALGITFNKGFKNEFDKVVKKFPLSINPYFLSLIDTNNLFNDPIFKQSFGDIRELNIMDYENEDPLAEEHDSPVEGLTHRYPDRILFHVSNLCSIYCRHCTRKRKVGDKNYIPDKNQLLKGIEYIKRTPVVRDVLLSGGDPLMLSDSYLEWLLSEIRQIPHVEIIRIGTRMPVVLPYRITDELVSRLRKYHPLWMNTQFNHPKEFTEASVVALNKLTDSGIPLGNQSVLLAGINDNVTVMKELSHNLVKNRVRPYYLYQCDLSEGLSHLRTPVSKGIEIMESLIGHTSGFARPAFVIDAPGGGGKVPINPNYIVSTGDNKVTIRNYEGNNYTYYEPEKSINNANYMKNFENAYILGKETK